ncbi:MAG: alpha-glucosidase, partial [Yoonia sp.]
MNEWWRSAVVYQVYPRSYQDDNGDGVGDLNGITRRLDHIVELGVDCIWLSPIFASPQADMGYDVSDYIAVDPLFGDLVDFDALIQAAHARGLKVIVDQVLSHTSEEHDWFKESRKSRDNEKADWYVWADPLPDGSPPTNWHSHFGGPAWEFDPQRGQYYLHNFLAS